MDLREKIAEVLYEPPTGASGMSKLLAEDAHDRRVNAVMGVVEEDAVKRRAYTERRVELARKAEAAKWERRMREQKEEGDAIIAEEDARVRGLEAENTRLRDDLASRIVEEERSVQEQITKEPLNSWLAGVLFGLQRGRDIVTSRAREIAEEEA